jgi:hypothetical protein
LRRTWPIEPFRRRKHFARSEILVVKIHFLEQLGFSLEILLFLAEVCFHVSDGSLGRVQSRLVIGRINFKQKVAGLYL